MSKNNWQRPCSQIRFKWLYQPCVCRKHCSRAFVTGRTFATAIRDLVSLTVFFSSVTDYVWKLSISWGIMGYLARRQERGAVLVLVTVFRQRNLQFWLMLALFYTNMFWHVAPQAFPKYFRLMRLNGRKGNETGTGSLKLLHCTMYFFHNRIKVCLFVCKNV